MKKGKMYIVSNIKWDTDGDKEAERRLPHVISIKEETVKDLIRKADEDADDEEAVSETVSDYISDLTGFCHAGFYLERVSCVTGTYRVYGRKGHRQKESFSASYKYDFSMPGDVRVIEVFNSDITGTNEYSVVHITRNTKEECEDEMSGQISDGIFENCVVGDVMEVRGSVEY